MYATVDEFRGRIDDLFAAQVTSKVGTIDPARIQRALEDASAELDGYLPRVPAGMRPGAATLRIHAIKIAFYLLTGGRPGKEFESVRNGYVDTITFYRELISGAASSSSPITPAADAPPEVFTPSSLKGFV